MGAWLWRHGVGDSAVPTCGLSAELPPGWVAILFREKEDGSVNRDFKKTKTREQVIEAFRDSLKEP